MIQEALFYYIHIICHKNRKISISLDFFISGENFRHLTIDFGVLWCIFYAEIVVKGAETYCVTGYHW